jgi:hypothetical protein
MRLSHLLSLLPLLSGSRAATFTSCNAAQISTLEAAIDRATNKSYAAISHLEDNPTGSDIQTTWYGTDASVAKADETHVYPPPQPPPIWNGAMPTLPDLDR